MVLKIEKETAKRIYPESPEWFKEQLIEAFGKECFKKRSFGDIKTFEDACNELGIDPNSVTNEKDSQDEAAYKQLKVIAKAVNQGWAPDWSNGSQYKYYPWFEVLSSGFGFSGSSYGCTGTDAGVGSRLCFESREKSDYMATQFIDLYKQFLL